MQLKDLRLKRALRTALLVLLLSVAGMGKMYASYDFSAVCETGQTLYYNIIDVANHYVTLVYPGSADYSGWSGFTKPTGDIVLPENVQYEGNTYAVTSIGDYAFYNCSGLTGSLTIPNSVATIGTRAFYICSGLTGSLTIPNSVTTIGYGAFTSCNNFDSIVVESGNTVYDSRESCNALIKTSTNELIQGCKNSIIPNSVTMIGDGAFCGCGLMGSLTIGNSVTTIGACAFYGCSGLTGSLIIPNSVTMIGDRAFYGCSGLTGSLTIPNSVTTIGSYAFHGCSGLTGSLIIPNSVTMIGDRAFYGCSGLTGSLTIGNSVTTIGGFAFYNCSGLSSITVLAETPPFLASFVFWGVDKTIPVYVPFGTVSAYQAASGWNEFTNLQEYGPCPICFADANVKAICIDNWDTNSDGELSYDEAAAVTDLGQVFRGNTTITSFEELQYFTGLTTISSYAFYNCNNLSGSLYIPNSVTEIGASAFCNCSGLIGNLTIPNSVTSIGISAFSDCSGFTGDLTIPNSVTTISDNAFYGCSGFTGSLTIGNSVTTISSGAFSWCNGLTGSLTIPNSVTTIGDWAFSGCRGLTGGLTIGNSVTEIGSYAFADCSGFTGDLTIPNSVTTISDNAFYGCSGFTGSLTIGNSVATIGVGAFSNCSGFTGSLTIPNSVTTIGDWAFGVCSGFTGNLTIGNSVTTIGIQAFSSCSGFTGSLIIGNSVTEIGDMAFFGCIGLTGSLTIPDSVTDIGSLAFSWCNGFTGSLTIPNSVTSIGNSAFANCSGFTGELVIPSSVTTIGDNAFYGCSGLSEMMMFGTIPLTLGYGAFDYSDFPIYVPYESLNEYKTATNWSNYEDRIFPMAYKTIPGYGEGDGNYRFIASPLVENTDPTTVDNMITETAYDLYRFDQSEDAEWQNYKAQTVSFVLENGQGYLYANAEEVNVIFKGDFNEDETKEMELAYDANADFAGWNLVGNPFPVNAYANKSYYTMNEDGTAVEPNAVSSATVIPACTGVMVKADDQGESVVFNTTAPETASNKGSVQIALSQVVDRGGVSTGSTTAVDKAIVSFNAGDRLEKYVFNKDNARISIPQGGKDLAIACADKQGEMPLDFRATKNGTYTFSVDVENADVDYLHLIDNLTGADVDLLVSPEYTFDAKTSDYASRFRLVFSVCGDADGDNAPFAFINNGNIIVTGAEAGAVLQIVDVTGRIIVCRDAARHVSTSGMTPGVYILRLINGNDAKTQKIVID